MKLISTPKKLEKEFLRLQKEYNEYYWLAAWAGTSSLAFERLEKNKKKIKKIVVGIHFYQTHPDFIETFLKDQSVRYIMQPSGTFHPKLYLFYNSNTDWEVLIGSANFTNAAFTRNSEICTLISSKDKDAAKVLSDVFEAIDSVWENTEQFDKNKLKDYRRTWKNKQPEIDRLSGFYGEVKENRQRKMTPIHLVSVANMDWSEFMIKVKNDKLHSVDTRLKVLDVARNLFEKVDSFSELSDDERKFIAGTSNRLEVDDDVDWRFFGTMSGNGIFANRIKENDINISNALDEIPLLGQITKIHYERFIDAFKKTSKDTLTAPASRLLAMKRPDVFVCLNSKNKRALCKDFDIVQSGINYERYWNEVIARIYDSEWWINPKPKNKTERRVSEARAAFLDSLYYEGQG